MKYLDEVDIALWERCMLALKAAMRGLEPGADSKTKSEAYRLVFRVLKELSDGPSS